MKFLFRLPARFLLTTVLLAAGSGAARADVASDYSDTVFTETNLARQANGLTILRRDARLDAAARGWAAVVADVRQLVHELPGQPTLAQRLTNQGYRFLSFGENLAFG